MTTPNKELSSNDSNLSKFNHNTSLLIVQLLKIYPDDKDLIVYRDKFEWSKKVNARLACEKFILEAAPYTEQIMNEDEQFFLDMNYRKYTDNENYVALMHKVADLWRNSDNEQLKKNIWRFFKILMVYGIKITKRRDLAEIVNVYRQQKNKPPLIV